MKFTLPSDNSSLSSSSTSSSPTRSPRHRNTKPSQTPRPKSLAFSGQELISPDHPHPPNCPPSNPASKTKAVPSTNDQYLRPTRRKLRSHHARSSNSVLNPNSEDPQPSSSKICSISSVPKSQLTPSPFANPPPRGKSPSTGFRPVPRTTLRLKPDYDSSSLSIGNDEDEQDEQDDEYDSEEEQWPVRKSQPSQQPKQSMSRRTTQRPGPSFLVVDEDPVRAWEEEQRQSTYQLSIENALVRRRHFECMHIRTLERANENRERESKQQMDQLSDILGRIGLDQERESRLVAEGFEQRERERARVFEKMIREAEKLDEEEALRLNRLKQEEAARKAELERLELQKRQQLEEARKKRAEEQLKLKLLQQREEEQVVAKKAQQEEEARAQAEANTKDDLKLVRDNYEKWNKAMQSIKDQVLPKVSSNEALKAVCRQAKRKITPRVGQLTNSYQQIHKIMTELGDVLAETKKSGNEVYLWACNHLSKALIRQAETEVTAKLNTVYPLGRVVVGLIMVGYREVGEVLMARLTKKCYFVSAYRPAPKAGLTKNDYLKQLGYQSEAGGGPEESTIQYSNRMAGMIALYASILQTDLFDIVPALRKKWGSSSEEKWLSRMPREMRLDHSWNWISHMLKPPMVKCTSTPQLITTFVKVAGPRLFLVYGSQWIKLVRVILEDGICKKLAGFEWENCKPTVVQLEAVLEEIVASSRHGIGCKQLVEMEGRLYE